jgi:hypothetical protein
LPEIRCITSLKEIALDGCEDGYFYKGIDPKAKDNDSAFVFTVYLTTGMSVQFGFLSYKEGRAARKELIYKLSEFVGADHMIYSSGLDSEITTVNAVDETTKLFTKDRKAGFSIIVKDVPFPLHLVFDDPCKAEIFHRDLSARIEDQKHINSMLFKRVAVG